MLGRDLSGQEIREMLRHSGISPRQIREQLVARGFHPAAADSWLGVLEGQASQVPHGTSTGPLLGVLAGTRAGRQAGLDTTRLDRFPTDSLLELQGPEFGPPGMVMDFHAAGEVGGLEIEDASRRVDLSALEAGSVPLSNLPAN